GSDYAVLGSEPTPSALSDLQRIVEVVRGFGIVAGVILNRNDMDEKSAQTTRDWLAQNEWNRICKSLASPCPVPKNRS
ncbi:MAG: hypothetical protein D3912_10365, partial [Candidatus Electrothrix sp. AX1]|nr:hypothetical protein [Candidatus Electrothrix sp. AX1]